ncbi:CtxA-like, cholera toxin A subunit [Bartonella bovis]|uniref:CtxA-like, cholera toxin A subunit n=1 Tax=Bartonella bovis 91-4 TaxID=1094491 RepID=N6VGJ3_9HYPH|nr:CtxA-like, cholera toxin A subunit [Bartonella bovis]ENN90217.1 CtxA-like, cholera toxin A subunit [Bartonella bovis 91-4]
MRKTILKSFISLMIFIFSCSAFADSVQIVYRATKATPEDAKIAGGLYPKGLDELWINQPPPNINLWDHVSSVSTTELGNGYISTTTARKFAIGWVHFNLDKNGYVYHIKTTPNFVDVNESLGKYSPYSSEREVAALGVIHWNQIIGWERIRNGKVDPFVPNPDYNERLYGSFSSSGAQPQLAGFPINYKAWTEHPWVEFSNCVSKLFCFPIKSAQEFGEEFFWKAHYSILGVIFAILD